MSKIDSLLELILIHKDDLAEIVPNNINELAPLTSSVGTIKNYLDHRKFKKPDKALKFIEERLEWLELEKLNTGQFDYI